MTNQITQMITFCKENKCIPDEPAEHAIENGKQTKAALYQLILTKFKKYLLQYEQQETLDKFDVIVPKYFSFRIKLRNLFNGGE